MQSLFPSIVFDRQPATGSPSKARSFHKPSVIAAGNYTSGIGTTVRIGGCCRFCLRLGTNAVRNRRAGKAEQGRSIKPRTQFMPQFRAVRTGSCRHTAGTRVQAVDTGPNRTSTAGNGLRKIKEKTCFRQPQVAANGPFIPAWVTCASTQRFFPVVAGLPKYLRPIDSRREFHQNSVSPAIGRCALAFTPAGETQCGPGKKLSGFLLTSTNFP